MIAYIDGHNRANGGDTVEPPSDEDFERLLTMHNVSQAIN